MNRLTSDDISSIEALQVDDLVNWVEAHGWKRIAHPNEKVFVFTDPLPDGEPPLTIVIPRHTRFLDTYQRFAETIQTLAQYYDRSPEAIIEAINKQRRYRLRPMPGKTAQASKRPTLKARRSKPPKPRNPKNQRSTQ